MDAFWHVKHPGPDPTFLHLPGSTFQPLHQYFCWLGGPPGWETPRLPQGRVIFCIRGVTVTSFWGSTDGDTAWTSAGNWICSTGALERHTMRGFLLLLHL